MTKCTAALALLCLLWSAAAAEEEVASASIAIEQAYPDDDDGVDVAAAADDTQEQRSTVPAECNDLAKLVSQLAEGTFHPSVQERWAPVRTETWRATPAVHPSAEGEGRCDVDRVAAAQLSPETFKEVYLEQRPVIIVNATRWTEFAAMTEKRVLLYCFGDFDVTLSTANKNSYQKREASFRHYVATMMSPTTMDARGAAAQYFFGDNRHDEWEALFKHYRKPAQYTWSHTSLSFGTGGSGSGVPFHTHGHVFAEVFHGRKRWYLQAPGPEPRFDPDETSLRWTALVYPTFTREERSKILDCVCSPGELLYIPGHWHHSTLNLGDTVFMSAFV